ncbi:uncharacterized protein A4U43_C08F3740 [Asparagus officinalis]|nr:uncharacterized protein A4U43_C08F3740 [Asparagus officinalis]
MLDEDFLKEWKALQSKRVNLQPHSLLTMLEAYADLGILEKMEKMFHRFLHSEAYMKENLIKKLAMVYVEHHRFVRLEEFGNEISSRTGRTDIVWCILLLASACLLSRKGVESVVREMDTAKVEFILTHTNILGLFYLKINDFKALNGALSRIEMHKLKPDMVTFGILFDACKTGYNGIRVLEIIPLYRNPSIRRNPTCLGNWRRLLIPGFILRPGVIFRRKKEKKMAVKKMSDSMGNTMLLIAKNIRVEKQQGFVKKLLSTFRRRNASLQQISTNSDGPSLIPLLHYHVTNAAVTAAGNVPILSGAIFLFDTRHQVETAMDASYCAANNTSSHSSSNHESGRELGKSKRRPHFYLPNAGLQGSYPGTMEAAISDIRNKFIKHPSSADHSKSAPLKARSDGGLSSTTTNFPDKGIVNLFHKITSQALPQ